VEDAIAAFAGCQYGRVSLEQLHAAGLHDDAIQYRVAMGRLHPEHQGVFAVGYRNRSREARWMAAALLSGPASGLGRRSSAALLDLVDWDRPTTDIVAAKRIARTTPGIRARLARNLTPSDLMVHRGIPCTTVEWTLVDLAASEHPGVVKAAVTRAEKLRIYDGRAMAELLKRRRGNRGVARLRAIIDALEGPELTRNDLERRFKTICRRAQVPQPLCNSWLPLDGVPGGGFRPDFLWRDGGLIVETDGQTDHGTRKAFEDDRARDQRLMVEGFRVVRFTWRQVRYDPAKVASILRSLLASAP